MKSPTDILRDEHTLILGALDVLETAAGRLEAGQGPADRWWEDALGWFRSFADRNHHAKEEELLFPAMIRAGVPSDGGPIEVMLEEHAQGRALLQSMATGDSHARARATRRYVHLLRDHIDKEHDVVFPLAEAVLDERAVERIAREFEDVETQDNGGASVRGAEVIVERLRTALAVLAAR